MQGRLHYYEGYSMEDITYPVRVMAKLGVKNLLLSNAAGGINTDFAPGQLMLITDHINFLGRNPLMGPNEADFGVRFCDMSYAYHPELRRLALEAAEELGQNLAQGVYVATTGPSYETPAEIRMFRMWGASAVGMSTVPEVIVANHSGLRVMGISCITNMAAGVLDQPLTEEEVLETGAKSGAAFQALMTRIVEKL
jgi:purine-nucleoside phosphorylase